MRPRDKEMQYFDDKFVEKSTHKQQQNESNTELTNTGDADGESEKQRTEMRANDQLKKDYTAIDTSSSSLTLNRKSPDLLTMKLVNRYLNNNRSTEKSSSNIQTKKRNLFPSKAVYLKQKHISMKKQVFTTTTTPATAPLVKASPIKRSLVKTEKHLVGHYTTEGVMSSSDKKRKADWQMQMQRGNGQSFFSVPGLKNQNDQRTTWSRDCKACEAKKNNNAKDYFIHSKINSYRHSRRFLGDIVKYKTKYERILAKIDEESYEKIYKCSSCNMDFKYHANLKTHFTFVHNWHREEDKGSFLSPCVKLTKEIKDDRQLRTSNKQPCSHAQNVPGKTIHHNVAQTLNLCINKRKNVAEMVSCETCHKIFKYDFNLQTHMKMMHI